MLPRALQLCHASSLGSLQKWLGGFLEEGTFGCDLEKDCLWGYTVSCLQGWKPVFLFTPLWPGIQKVLNECGGLPASPRALVAPPLPVSPPKIDVRFRLLSWGQDHLLCWSWRGVSISSRAVGRVAVKVTGDVSCSPDCHSVPALACHCPGFTSLDLSLPHCSLIAPVGQLPPLAPFGPLSHLSKASWSHCTLP